MSYSSTGHEGSKDKGKQKVRENLSSPDNTSASPSSAPSDSARFVVKFSDSSIADLTLDIESIQELSVSALRRQIRQQIGGKTLNRRLRLIRNGRVLNDQMDLSTEVFGRNSAAASNADAAAAAGPPKIYIHCSIGDILSPTDLAKENEYDQRVPTRSTLPELRGFDRLRSTGFSDDDIAQLRQQFGRLYGYGGTNEDMTNMEEQWIDTGVQDGPADINLGGDYVDDLIGILVGMFLGVLALFFLKENNLFSKRQQKSMVAGILVNFSFALLRNLM